MKNKLTVEDVRRINYIQYTSYRPLIKSPHSLIMCYFLFVVRTLRELFRHHTLKEPTSPILFFALTINNRRAIESITKHLNIRDYTVWNDFNDIPWSLIYLKSIKNISIFHKFYKDSVRDDQILIRQFYKTFMYTTGCYEVFDKILDKYPQLKLIVLANDHNTENRCLIELAKKKSISTLYVQHASVTYKFPPLRFTFSFLDGKETFNKYKAIGDLEGDVFLTGGTRFDAVQVKRGEGDVKYDVGIALNALDDLNKVIELCEIIRKSFSKSIIVRPHPAMGGALDLSQLEKLGVVLSNSREENSFAFLSRIKFLVANESSIHLDSAMMSVPSILYNFSNTEIKDWYSYLENKLIIYAESSEVLINILKNGLSSPVDSIRFYNASYKTKYEGCVGQIIAGFIENYIDSYSKALTFINQFMNKGADCYEYKK